MIGTNIKSIRKSLGLTQTELAEKAGVSAQSIWLWETGQTSPKGKRLDRLAEALEISPDELLTHNFSKTRIPVYGVIPAGIPMEAIEDIIDYEDIPSTWAGEYFALRVKGDSMYPRYMTGDTVIVRAQNTCDNGQDCVVLVNGFDATLKQVYAMDDGVELRSVNPAYENMKFKDVKILGVVAELRRKML